MKSLTLAAGALLAVAATAADAQYYRESPNNWRGMAGYECWNPRAGHFEGVREGDRQDDLDFGRCRRTTDARNYSYDERTRYNNDDRTRYYNDERNRYGNREPVSGYECWNSNARHYEAVRQGEIQDDLDFSRCRNGSYAYRYR